MADLAHTLGLPNGHRANLGLIVLQSDETVEPELQRVFAQDGVAVYVSRVPSGAEVTPDTLAEMERAIPIAAGLLPPSVAFDVVGYCCTSGTAVIGADQVARAVNSVCTTAHVTDPLSALIAQCRAKKVRKLALISPYIEPVNARMRQRLADAGIETPVFASFGVAQEAKVARIDAASLRAAVLTTARGAARGTDVDAAFLSCTNLQTLTLRPQLQQELGMPLFTSNHALAWHMAQLAGLEIDQPRAFA